MLESWSIGRRVAVGFLFLNIVLIGLAGFSHMSVQRLGDGYTDYRATARQTVSINAFVEDLFEARVAALKFRMDATIDSRDQVISNIDEILEGDVFLETFEHNPLRLAEVEHLVSQASRYKADFAESAALSATAITLKTAIMAQSEAIEDAMVDLFEASNLATDPQVLADVGTALHIFMQSKYQTAVYFLTNDEEQHVHASQTFGRFVAQLGVLATQNPRGAFASQLATVQSLTAGYDEDLTAFGQAHQAAHRIEVNALDRLGPEIQEEFDRIASEIVDHQNEIGPEGAAIATNLRVMIPTIGAFATFVAVVAALLVGKWISGSVRRLANTTSRLADGEVDVTIAGAEHKHELGQMARALVVFQEARIERNRIADEREAMQKSQDDVVSTLQAELAQLADGNLTAQVRREFDPQYEDLRANFNSAMASLQSAISKVSESSSVIRSTTAQTNAANNELSQRTENQAATLEETAAALDQLTASVRSAAEHAKSVDISVNKARSEAEKNGEVVAEAVDAMGEIEQSSKQISQVISVIDDIAFQTNLLALNAGVEAARAGESGRGFAVVASEVRALAQRSAEAAKEISALIANSSKHVSRGTQLVGNAGDALSEIIAQVNEIAGMISQIANSSQEQAVGLSEINIGVNQLDQVTQQNAAMVQESISRGESLSREADNLSELIARFKIDDRGTSDQSAQPRYPANGVSSDTGPSHDALSAAIAQTHQYSDPAPTPRMRKSAAGGHASESIWEDF